MSVDINDCHRTDSFATGLYMVCINTQSVYDCVWLVSTS